MALPAHLKKRLPRGRQSSRTRALLAELELHTVCDEARCPNRVECHDRGTAAFLIMGNICTRSCGFCSVRTGRPGPLDPNEPVRVAEGVRRLELRHAVVTSVDRDDLPDGGAAHFAATVRAIRSASDRTTIEVLTPDFQGDLGAVDTVLEAAPEVFNHNLETVERLCRSVRPSARFETSLRVLRHAKQRSPATWTKTGLMVGLGETAAEVIETLHLAREAQVDIVTIGQYLRPTPRQLPVAEHVAPEQFERFAAEGRALGFTHVFSGPFVRSSYMADHLIPA